MTIQIRDAEIKGHGAKLLYKKHCELKRIKNRPHIGLAVNELLNQMADMILEKDKEFFKEFYHEQEGD